MGVWLHCPLSISDFLSVSSLFCRSQLHCVVRPSCALGEKALKVHHGPKLTILHHLDWSGSCFDLWMFFKNTFGWIDSEMYFPFQDYAMTKTFHLQHHMRLSAPPAPWKAIKPIMFLWSFLYLSSLFSLWLLFSPLLSSVTLPYFSFSVISHHYVESRKTVCASWSRKFLLSLITDTSWRGSIFFFLSNAQNLFTSASLAYPAPFLECGRVIHVNGCQLNSVVLHAGKLCRTKPKSELDAQLNTFSIHYFVVNKLIG